MTLKEEAEKIVAEAFPCDAMEGEKVTCSDDPYSHLDGCSAEPRKNALSAVLKGMQLVLQGTPHLTQSVRGDARIPCAVEAYANEVWDGDHLEKYREGCARLGGACRIRELGEEEKR